MTDREKLAADLLACERFIQLSRDPAGVAAAKRWLAELEAEGLRSLGVVGAEMPRGGVAGAADVERVHVL
jgi:hypothetical protein